MSSISTWKEMNILRINLRGNLHTTLNAEVYSTELIQYKLLRSKETRLQILGQLYSWHSIGSLVKQSFV